MSTPPSSLRILLSPGASPALVRAAEALADALRTDTLRPARTLNTAALGPDDRRFEGLTLLTDPAQVETIALEQRNDLAEASGEGEGDRIVIRHLRVPVGLCVLAWGSTPAAAQRALAIIGEYLGLRVFPWGRVVVASHDERDLVSADVVLQARFSVRGLAPVRMTDRATWQTAEIEAYADFAAWNGYNLVAWPARIGTPAVPLRAGLARFEGASVGDCAEARCPEALATFRRRGLQAAVAFDPLQLPPQILDAMPASDLQPGGLAIQPFSETGQVLYRHLVAALHAAYQPDALVLAMSELPWRPGAGARAEPGQAPDALAFHAQLLGIYGPEAVSAETELYLQAAAALAQAARYLELDLPVILMGRHLAGLVSQQHQALPENCSLCPTPGGDLVSLADQLTRDAARGVPVFFDHLQSNHRPVWGALTVDETFLGDSPRVRSLDTILTAWLKVPMQGMILRHSRLHGCDENLLYTAQAVWGEIPSARLFYSELCSALYGAGAETMARARQGQEEIEAVSSVHDLSLATRSLGLNGGGAGAAPPWNEDLDVTDEDTLPASAPTPPAQPHEPPTTRSLRRIVAELLDRMPLALEALPEESYLLSFLRDLSSRNVRLAGILQAVEGSLARADLLSAEQITRIQRAAGRLTAKLEMGRFARAVMSAALLCRQAADPDFGGIAFGATSPIGGLTALHQALASLRKSPPDRILEVLQHEHTSDRDATAAVVEATLVEPWRQLVARLERLLGPQVARRQGLGPAQEILDPRRSARE